MKHLILTIITIGLLSSCGSGDLVNGGQLPNSTGFSAPSISPDNVTQNSFVNRVEISMAANADSIVFTTAVNELAQNPDCENTINGNVYAGPFMVGGPSETIDVKAISCLDDASSDISTGTYTFGP